MKEKSIVDQRFEVFWKEMCGKPRGFVIKNTRKYVAKLFYFAGVDLTLNKMGNIIVEADDSREALKDQLDREPTDAELKHFINYVEVDISQWLRDNAKAFDEVLREKHGKT